MPCHAREPGCRITGTEFLWWRVPTNRRVSRHFFWYTDFHAPLKLVCECLVSVFLEVGLSLGSRLLWPIHNSIQFRASGRAQKMLQGTVYQHRMWGKTQQTVPRTQNHNSLPSNYASYPDSTMHPLPSKGYHQKPAVKQSQNSLYLCRVMWASVQQSATLWYSTSKSSAVYSTLYQQELIYPAVVTPTCWTFHCTCPRWWRIQ